MFRPLATPVQGNVCQLPVAGNVCRPSFMEGYAIINRLRLIPFVTPLCTNLRRPIHRCASATSASTLKLRSTATSTLNLDEARPAEESSVSVTSQPPIRRNNRRKKANDVVLDAQLKENWLASISCPYHQKINSDEGNLYSELNGVANAASQWVIGIDPDVSGAIALLKPDNSVQVFDSPYLKVPVGGRARKRLDAKSIVQLLCSFDAPIGTTAYLEQSIPYPKDGKQGWWSSGYAYGLWIGVLVASGFSVIPVPAFVWKNEFKLSGKLLCKDDSREAASTIFPSMSSLLKRKKDHGRAEALLIAAYGKGQKLDANSLCIADKKLVVDGL